jgi:hypothetical protein
LLICNSHGLAPSRNPFAASTLAPGPTSPAAQASAVSADFLDAVTFGAYASPPEVDGRAAVDDAGMASISDFTISDLPRRSDGFEYRPRTPAARQLRDTGRSRNRRGARLNR